MTAFFRLLALLAFVFFGTAAYAQLGTIEGRITDAGNGSPLEGVTVRVQGTSLGARSDSTGYYRIRNVKHGSYTLEVSYVGYESLLFTGIQVTADKTTLNTFKMGRKPVTTGGAARVVGERPLIDIEEPKTKNLIRQDVIDAQPVRQMDKILNTQAGVINTPSGIHIRGGRTYETGFFIDDVSAKDPLAGTGFGLDMGSNSIDEIDVTTGGSGVEFGDATAGVVNAKTRSGGNKTQVSALYKRDNFGNNNWNSVYNQQVFELGVGGPIGKKKKVKYYTSFRGNFSDQFTKNPAKQLNSSLFPGSDNFFSPYEDNRWSAFGKLNWDISQRKKLQFSYMKSITINQDLNMLRITGNDVPYSPGYQYQFQNQMDNANTFTHSTDLETITWSDAIGKRFAYKLTGSRLFVKLRADANGRDWRPTTVDGEFDPRSLPDYPAGYFNPQDSVVFVNASSGFYNNGGIATLWHDHYVEEYTIRGTGNFYSSGKNSQNKLSFGFEQKFQEMQWIDISRPWIGAPIVLANGDTSQSFRLGEYSDVWKVNPQRGAVFASNQIKFRGLIAEVGGRFEWWAPGKFVDDAVANPDASIREEIRQEYLNSSYKILGRRYKFRLLPKVSASFPIRENQMLYFNYGHNTILPHPSFVYAGLDPYYADRSTLARLGNPNLNPEVDISYEIGLRSQITQNDALNLSAYWKDKYDFITSVSIPVEDITGREVYRTMRINSDYARIRGVEATYIKRIKKWFTGQLSVAYMVATGQSASASESLKEILASGAREDTREFYLPWDCPLDIKTNIVITQNTKDGLWKKKWLNHFSFYFEAYYRSGRRYTPYLYTGDEPITGRPVYVVNSDPNARYSKLGKAWFNADFNFRKWWVIKKKHEVAFTFEITNLFNNKNVAIVNPVTGRAYESGDNVPTEWRDLRYNDPRDPRSSGLPPTDPARYLEQRHYMVGLIYKLK